MSPELRPLVEAAYAELERQGGETGHLVNREGVRGTTIELMGDFDLAPLVEAVLAAQRKESAMPGKVKLTVRVLAADGSLIAQSTSGFIDGAYMMPWVTPPAGGIAIEVLVEEVRGEAVWIRSLTEDPPATA